MLTSVFNTDTSTEVFFNGVSLKYISVKNRVCSLVVECGTYRKRFCKTIMKSNKALCLKFEIVYKR